MNDLQKLTTFFLRKDAPPPLGITVNIELGEVVPNHRLAQTVWEKWGKATITLDREKVENSPALFGPLLAHEYAHVLAQPKSGNSHDDNWGIEYARCWRALTLEEDLDCQN